MTSVGKDIATESIFMEITLALLENFELCVIFQEIYRSLTLQNLRLVFTQIIMITIEIRVYVRT